MLTYGSWNDKIKTKSDICKWQMNLERIQIKKEGKSHMENKNKILLDRIICQKANEFGFEMIKPEHSGTVVSIMREDWHLFIEMRSPVVPPLQLQMEVHVGDQTMRMFVFPSPIIIHSKNISQFIYLANIANHYLYWGTALGRFWVDEEELDFAYEVKL